MIGKTLLGVGAGRLASLVIALGLAAAVLTLPLIIMLGVVGAALALAITNLIRLVVAWVALRWLIAKETTTAELARKCGGSMTGTSDIRFGLALVLCAMHAPGPWSRRRHRPRKAS